MDSTSPQSTNVLVTGAAGRVGRRVAAWLQENGYAVRGSDIAVTEGLSFPCEQVDLRDHEATTRAVAGAQVVIHLGNHPGLAHPQTTFNENVTMNMNVFQAAAEHGVRKVIFASSIQVIGSIVDRATVKNTPPLPDIPLSGNTPSAPANAYALSKQVGEVMLRYYVERCGLAGIALRFPYIQFLDTPLCFPATAVPEHIIREAYTYLPASDLCRLIETIVRTDLPGYRHYLPGKPVQLTDAAFAEIVRQHYPDAPEGVASLVENSTITRETGWKPSGD